VRIQPSRLLDDEEMIVLKADQSRTIVRYHCGNLSDKRLLALPKMPFTSGYYPNAQTEVGDRMRGDGIAEPFLPTDQAGINDARR
jgi:hypothetical protein